MRLAELLLLLLGNKSVLDRLAVERDEILRKGVVARLFTNLRIISSRALFVFLKLTS